ncbi:MAG: multi-sensor hybrid histidine kinase [Polyangiaceae bacterium]|nr:multi-sensor hybrid histidine kinase [Polyangiaceae bacterium]
MSDAARRTIDFARNAPSAVRLTVVEGPTVGQEFKLDGAATIGRSPDATVMVDDPGVSRLHARIRRSEVGTFEVEDLGSKNGTFLNGTRVEQAPAAFGDKIRVGPRVVLTLSSFDVVEEQVVQRQRLETIGRLGAGIAHDLNNVLAALHAGTAFLQQLAPSTDLGDARVRECLRDLSLATSQGAELTRGILRIVRGKRSVREPVDLGQLAVEVSRILRHTIDHSIQVETVVDPEVVVHGNHSELQQVLLNLCLNARDAMPQGGKLGVVVKLAHPPAELGLPTERPCALLEVSDTGQGIDAEARPLIFEPFFTTKREGAGFGIGLSTVRDLVKLHGGRIALESGRSKGSVFSLYFPAVDVQSFATTGERAPAELPFQSERPVSLLLVDDEQLLRRSFGRLLRQHGFQVTEAAGGAEALSLYAGGKHDLVILDLDMPGMSGEETQVQLLQRVPEARLMFASGHADPQREHVVRERGARAFLQKPYEIELLVDTIHQVMRQPTFCDERTLIGGS